MNSKSPFKWRHYQSEVILRCVRWYLSYPLSRAPRIAPDLPGYGNSKSFALNDYALPNQATLLHELMEKLGIKSFDLAGSSMGGAIAWLYAQRYPNQVRSLAFIGSPLGVVDWANSVKAAIFQGINPFIPISKEQFAL